MWYLKMMLCMETKLIIVAIFDTVRVWLYSRILLIIHFFLNPTTLLTRSQEFSTNDPDSIKPDELNAESGYSVFDKFMRNADSC
jgi:hypothetical protein